VRLIYVFKASSFGEHIIDKNGNDTTIHGTHSSHDASARRLFPQHYGHRCVTLTKVKPRRDKKDVKKKNYSNIGEGGDNALGDRLVRTPP